MKTGVAAWCLLFLVTISGQAQTSVDVLNYINAYKDIAISEMQRTGVPAAITLAQGIHETLAGTSDLVRRSNNHFGIKCKEGWTGDVVYHDDDSRGECFRGYNSPQDSYKDHSDFLKSSSRYGFLFKLDPMDYEGWANGLRQAGYATNRRYADILIRLIRDYHLQQYSLIATGKLKAPLEGGYSATLESPPGEISQKIYPQDAFFINRSKVIFAKQGSSLLAISEQYGIALSRLLEFNDLEQQENILKKDQLLFLQRKRKQGGTDIHIVQQGESVYDVAQAEGVRMESLLELNQLSIGEQPASGEKLYLQSPAPVKPPLETSLRSGVQGSGQTPVSRQ
jgi:LysM repeat protein